LELHTEELTCRIMEDELKSFSAQQTLIAA